MTCWLRVRLNDLMRCKCFWPIMLYVARMQRYLLVLFGLRLLWHVTTTTDLLLTPFTISIQLHAFMHSVDEPPLHPNMAGMLGQGVLDASLLKLLKSICCTSGLRFAFSCASLSEALSFSGSVVGALHVKFWHTNAVAGRSVFHPARCHASMAVRATFHTACNKTGPRAFHDTPNFRRGSQRVAVHELAALIMSELPTDPQKAASINWQCVLALRVSYPLRDVGTARLRSSTLRHGQGLRIMFSPEAGAGFIRGIYQHDNLVRRVGCMRCVHERLCVRGARPACYDDLAHVACAQQSQADSARCTSPALPHPYCAPLTRRYPSGAMLLSEYQTLDHLT